MTYLKNISLITCLFIFALTGCKKNENTDPSPQSSSTSSDPQNNATGVPRNKTITYTFSEAMDPATINASTVLVTQGGAPVAGVVTYSGKTATFNPTNTLAANTLYTVTITTGAHTAAGNALSSAIHWNFTTAGSVSGLSAVNLGTAGNYVILAKTAINNNPTSAITGDMGLSPAATSYITGFSLTNATGYATSSQVTGHLFAADMVSPTSSNLTTAISDMNTAYNNAAARPSPDFLELGSGNIGGKTLTAGLYKWSGNVTIPASITLSGSATDIWIFQIAGNLTEASAMNITLSGGAQAKNIFWQVAGTTTIGSSAHFEGIILSKTAITLNSAATLNGRALAQTAVILDGNTVVQP